MRTTDCIILLVFGIGYLIIRYYFRGEKKVSKQREAYFSELDKSSTFTETTHLENISIIENKQTFKKTDYLNFIYGPIGFIGLLYMTNFHYLSFLIGIPLVFVWAFYLGMEDFRTDVIKLEKETLVLTKKFWFLKLTKQIKWKDMKLIKINMKDIFSKNTYEYTVFDLEIIKKGFNTNYELKISKEKLLQLGYSLKKYVKVEYDTKISANNT